VSLPCLFLLTELEISLMIKFNSDSSAVACQMLTDVMQHILHTECWLPLWNMQQKPNTYIIQRTTVKYFHVPNYSYKLIKFTKKSVSVCHATPQNAGGHLTLPQKILGLTERGGKKTGHLATMSQTRYCRVFHSITVWHVWGVIGSLIMSLISRWNSFYPRGRLCAGNSHHRVSVRVSHAAIVSKRLNIGTRK